MKCLFQCCLPQGPLVFSPPNDTWSLLRFSKQSQQVHFKGSTKVEHEKFCFVVCGKNSSGFCERVMYNDNNVDRMKTGKNVKQFVTPHDSYLGSYAMAKRFRFARQTGATSFLYSSHGNQQRETRPSGPGITPLSHINKNSRSR